MLQLISKETCKHKILRNLINIFILLVLYDSILRKWLLPSFSNVIMPIKLLVAILIVFIGGKYIRHYTSWELSFLFIGIIVFLTSLIFGHQNVAVAIWGCIPYWIGLFCCFTIGYFIKTEDIHRIGKLIVYTSIVNAFITFIQFLMPVNSIINTKGEEVQDTIAEMTAGELSGMFRPPGIFMSTTGSSMFLLLAFSFILYFMYLQKGILSRKVLFVSTFLVITTCICSVSRTSIFYILGMLIYFIIFCVRTKVIGNIFKTLCFIIPLALFFVITPFGQTALENMGNRFSNASESTTKGRGTVAEGNIQDIYNRTIGYNIGAIIDPHTLDGNEVPFWGYGQGMSTQTGGRILGISKHSGFALAEWDGLRIMCESGILFGWIIIFIRMGYVIRFFFKISYMRRKKLYLSLMLLPTFFITFFLSNTWGNAFNSCLAFFCGGLFLAAFRNEQRTIISNENKRYINQQATFA